jgi:hypothetical protein
MNTHPLRGKGQSTFFDVAQPRLEGTTFRLALTLGTREANIGRPLSHRWIYGIYTPRKVYETHTFLPMDGATAASAAYSNGPNEPGE